MISARRAAGTSSPHLELAELVADKICHDLSGLVGTIHALLDLLDDTPAESAEALLATREAAAALMTRLRVARAAWGQASERPLEEWRALAMTAATPRRQVVLDETVWRGLAPSQARLLLNVVLLAAETVGAAGEVFLSRVADEVRAEVRGPRVGAGWQVPDQATAAAATSVRDLQSAWTRLAAAQCGAELTEAAATLHIQLSP